MHVEKDIGEKREKYKTLKTKRDRAKSHAASHVLSFCRFGSGVRPRWLRTGGKDTKAASLSWPKQLCRRETWDHPIEGEFSLPRLATV